MTSFILPSLLPALLPLVELERGDIQLLCNFESLLSKMFVFKGYVYFCLMIYLQVRHQTGKSAFKFNIKVYRVDFTYLD